MKNNTSTVTYEEALQELQAIVNELETEKVSIDDLSNKVKRAKELVVLCKEKLQNTQEELQ